MNPLAGGFSNAGFEILCAIDAARVILILGCVAVQSVDCRFGIKQYAVTRIAEILNYPGAPRRRAHSHSVSNLHSSHIRRPSVRHNGETRAARRAQRAAFSQAWQNEGIPS